MEAIFQESSDIYVYIVVRVYILFYFPAAVHLQRSVDTRVLLCTHTHTHIYILIYDVSVLYSRSSRQSLRFVFLQPHVNDVEQTN